MRRLTWATNEDETRENSTYAIRLNSQGIDDLNRGKHTDDDGMKTE